MLWLLRVALRWQDFKLALSNLARLQRQTKDQANYSKIQDTCKRLFFEWNLNFTQKNPPSHHLKQGSLIYKTHENSWAMSSNKLESQKERKI